MYDFDNSLNILPYLCALGVCALGGLPLLIKRIRASHNKAASERGVLIHSLNTLMLGVFIASFSLGLVALAFHTEQVHLLYAAPGLVVVGCSGIKKVLAYFRNRHHVSSEGLVYGRLIGSPVAVRWTDVIEVDIEPQKGCIVLLTEDGRKTRVALVYEGLPIFASLVLQRVSPEKIHPFAQSVLADWAQYEP